MTLRDLLASMATLAVHGGTDRDITGLALDSRRVRPGDVFFALPGVQADGARFAADALDERYFGWDPARYARRGDHNLARAANQLAAARDLLRQSASLAREAARMLAAPRRPLRD